MATPLDAVTAVSQMIDKLADLLAKWIAGSDIRKLRKAVEYGERYIREAGPLLEKYLPKEEKAALSRLQENEKAFFKFN